jgi:hypothetical protein
MAYREKIEAHRGAQSGFYRLPNTFTLGEPKDAPEGSRAAREVLAALI